MSKHQTIKEMRLEIERLNKTIDMKIIHGHSYAVEARRHKFLISSLNRLSPRSSWFARSLNFASMFLF